MLKFQALADGGAELRIYEQIGEGWFGDGLTASQLHDQLTALGDVNQISVRINSPGGSVPDGVSIYNLLKEHPATITVHVDGMAASIASLIAMAASPGRLLMADNAMMMIHDPSTLVMGNASNLRATADVLDKIKTATLTSYVSRTGLPESKISEMMTAETWFTAAEARDLGFADAVSKSADVAVTAKFDLSAFRNHAKAAPKSAASAAPVAPVIQAVATLPLNTPQESVMNEVEKATAAATEAARVAEKARRSEIRSLFAPHVANHRDLLDTCLDDQECTPVVASKNLLDALGKAAKPLNPAPGVHVEAGVDERDKFVAAASNILLVRAGVEKRDPQNEYNGCGLGMLVRASMIRNGVRGVERLERAALAQRFFATHSTSDFPLVLANTANKALRKAYDEAQSTYQLWADVGSVSDFKSNSRIQLGTFNSLATIVEGGEYTYGTFGEEAETIQAVTKGRGLALTRQMLINDDLGAFVKRATMLGGAARRTVNEDVYTVLNANAATSDTGALFNATAVTTAGGHANLTATGTAISVASIAEGDRMMALQKDKGLKTQLNIMPKYLLAPRGKKQIAWNVLNDPTDGSQSNPNKKNFAATLGLELITDALLDASSATAWYLVADQNQVPLLEVAFLDGVQTPYTDEAVDWDTDALRMKVRMDYGVGAIDWRAGYKNNGA